MLIVISSISCQNEEEDACQQATIFYRNYPCAQWGIVVNGDSIRSRNIPDAFQQNGLPVCVTYTLFEDMALCPTICCGGTMANITSIQ